MIVNDRNLRDIFAAYAALFQEGLGSAAPLWNRIATPAPSTGTSTKLPWLKNVPGLRRWIGDRVVHALGTGVYEFTKLEYEDTVEVPNREIESDQYGVFGAYMRMMGEAFAAFPDEQVWAALAAGFTTACYDGKSFFATNHPVIGADGKAVNVSNYQAGAGSAWYLMVTKKAIKPIIWSVRKEKPFRQLTPMELVERNEKVEYGCYADAGCGYGFWQTCFASKAELTADNYAAARAAIMGYQGDHGRKLGLIPDLLVVPPAAEGAARKIVVNSLTTGGATNEWAGTAEVLVSPWLS